MRTRPLCVGGPAVTVVGSGDIALARAAARGIDAREVERAVHATIDRGLTLIDVAAEDGAQRVVGDTVRTLGARDRVVVVTRVDPVADPAHAQRDALIARLPIAHVQQRVEAALRATRLDALPLVLLPHRRAWCRAVEWAELRDTCARLVGDGKVLRWGTILDEPVDDRDGDPTAVLGGLTADDGRAAVLVTFHACARTAAPTIAAAAALGLAVLVRRPLAGGALAGTLGPGVRLAIDDDRRSLDDAQLAWLAEAVAALAALVRHVPPAARATADARSRLEHARTRRPPEVECATLAELALRFAIDHAGVTCVLPRLHRAEHVDEAIAAAGARPLPDALVARLIADVVELAAT